MHKVAIVTGASRGIGKQVAFELASAGYELVLISRSEDKLNEVADEIHETYKNNKKSIVIPLDVADEHMVNETISNVICKKGRVDVLFNGAGIFGAGSIDVSLHDIHAMLNTNLIGPINLIKAIKSCMEAQKSGYIINMASRSGKHARPHGGIYAASKFGLVGLGESLYQELANYNIKVTTICPGVVDTQMGFASGIEDKNKIKVQDIAKVVLHLLSLSDSAYVKEYILDCRSDVTGNQQRPFPDISTSL